MTKIASRGWHSMEKFHGDIRKKGNARMERKKMMKFP